MGEKEVAFRAMLTALHDHVAKNAEHVGPRFAEEARAIHDGEAPARPIHGEASRAEAEELIEDGVPVMPLPVLPDDRN